MKVAIAGGSGGLGEHLVEEFLAAGHSTIVLSRKDDPKFKAKWPKSEFVKVDYDSISDLTNALQGCSVVICTFTVFIDNAVHSQKNLIRAALAAGVPRFCPSEFGGKLNTRPSYFRKAQVIEFLETEECKGLEWTAFSPGFFMDYFAVPHAKTHLAQFVAYVDAQQMEAIVAGDGDTGIVLTSAKDTARFCVAACELPKGSWPKFGSTVGERTSLNKIIATVEKLKRKKVKVHRHSVEEVEKGEFDWFPIVKHPSVPVDPVLSKRVCQEGLIGFAKGDDDFEGAFNKLCPDVKPIQLEEYLRDCWNINGSQLVD